MNMLAVLDFHKREDTQISDPNGQAGGEPGRP